MNRQTARRTLTGVLLAAAAIVLLFVLLGLVLPRLISTASVMTFLQKEVADKALLNVRSESLAWRILPTPQIDVRRLVVINPVWSVQEPVAVIDRLYVRFALWPLLIGRLRPITVDIESPRILAASRPDGSATWKRGTPIVSSTSPSLPSSPTAALFGHFSRLKIDNGLIQVRLASVQRDFSATLTLRQAGDWRLDGDIAPEIKNVADGPHIAVSARVARNGQISGDASFVGDRTHLPATVSARGFLPSLFDTRPMRIQVAAPESASLLSMLGLPKRTIAPLAFEGNLKWVDHQPVLDDIRLQLGEQSISGRLQWIPAKTSGAAQAGSNSELPTVRVTLRSDSLDWAVARRDAGFPPLPPKPPGELLSDYPYAWRLLPLIHGWRADVDARIHHLRLQNRLLLDKADLHLVFEPDRMTAPSFALMLMGGTAVGHGVFTGSTEHADVTLTARNISVAEWRQQLGRPALFNEAPLDVDAVVRAHGASLKELAAHLEGPVTLRLGPTTILPRKAATSETWFSGLATALTGHSETNMQLICVRSRLLFRDGRADMTPIVGVRTEKSQVLASGNIDLANQTLDLRGRVRPLKATDFGVASIVGNIRMSGPLKLPRISLDPRAAPLDALRAGAAVLTFGLSALATNAIDAAGQDACSAMDVVAVKRPQDRSSIGERAIPLPAGG